MEQSMTEHDFWLKLEFRLTRELEALREKGRSVLWCDGIGPEMYILSGYRPRILGRAYCGASGQEEWKFELLLSRSYESLDDIDWQSLLPASDVTRWLYFDRQRKFLQIEPAAAVPDAPFNSKGTIA
jgi:hypothetical protein